MFYAQLQKLCKEKGEKISPVVKKLDISPGAIGNWKKGAIPTGEVLIKFAEYFEVTTDYLLGLSEQKENKFEVIKTEEKDLIEKNYENLTWKEIKTTLTGLRNKYNISNDESLEKTCSEIGIHVNSWIYMEFWFEEEFSLKTAIEKEFEKSEDEQTNIEIIYNNQHFFHDPEREYLIHDFKKIIRYFVNIDFDSSVNRKYNDKNEENNINVTRAEFDELKRSVATKNDIEELKSLIKALPRFNQVGNGNG